MSLSNPTILMPNLEPIIYKQLRDSLKDRSRAFRLLEVDWPDAIDTVKRLCTYISDAIRDGNGADHSPILNIAVKFALDDYYKALLIRENDHLRYAIFIRSLVYHLAGALENISVMNEYHSSVWRPDDGEPFIEWIQSTDTHRLKILRTKTSRDQVIEALRQYLLMPYQLDVVYKTDFEGLEARFA